MQEFSVSLLSFMFNISLFPAVLFDMCFSFFFLFLYLWRRLVLNAGLLPSGSSFSSVCFSSRFSAAGPIFSLGGLKNCLCVQLKTIFCLKLSTLLYTCTHH